MVDPVSRVVLGTAQMGLRYGVANRFGKPGPAAIGEILSHAKSAGISMLDTAAAYGDSEQALGRAGLAGWEVITKIPPLSGRSPRKSAEMVRASVLSSRENLAVERLHGVLLHDARDAAGPAAAAVFEALMELRSEGVVSKLGVSIYRQEDLSGLVDSFCPEIVQAPLNPLDQRIFRTGAAAEIVANGGELHARSLFLQGLLLMPPGSRPKHFRPWADALDRFDERVTTLGVDPLAFCLTFAASNRLVSRLVVGVETASQLDTIVHALRRADEVSDTADLACDDARLVEPRHWGSV